MKYLINIQIIAGHWTGKSAADINTAPYTYKKISVDTLYSNSYATALRVANNIRNSQSLELPKGCKAWDQGFTVYKVSVKENN